VAGGVAGGGDLLYRESADAIAITITGIPPCRPAWRTTRLLIGFQVEIIEAPPADGWTFVLGRDIARVFYGVEDPHYPGSVLGSSQRS
jgi:hypothetical protein